MTGSAGIERMFSRAVGNRMTVALSNGWVLDDISTSSKPSTNHTTSKSFDGTIFERGAKRLAKSTVHAITTTPDGTRIWEVDGIASYGDTSRSYEVSLQHGARKYKCYCAHRGGAYRLCSHVTAVILYRQSNADPVREQEISVTGETVSLPSQGGSVEAPAIVATAEVDETDAVQPVMSLSSHGDNDTSFPHIPLPGDPSFGAVPLPDWVKEIRPHQWQAVQEIVEAFKTNDVVFLDAPTGSGKTLVAELVRRLMGKGGQPTSAAYICSGKTLQDQFLADYSYAAVLKGRSNYPTLFGGDEVTAADCVYEGDEGEQPVCITGCHEQVARCPYTLARRRAGFSDLAVVNTAYFFAEANGQKSIISGRPLGILDECDVLEGELMGRVEVVIGEYRLKELKVGLPEFKTKPEAWKVWIDGELIPALVRAIDKIPSVTHDVKKVRKRKSLEGLLERLRVVSGGVLNEGWVFDGYNDNKVIFKPVRVNQFGGEYLWRHFSKTLLMSATIVSPEELVQSLGLEGSYATVRVPMTFAVENRPVRVVPVANMTAKNKDEAWPQLARSIGRILDNHPDDRVLVHTVSYQLAGYLMANVKIETDGVRSLLTYKNATERDAALAKYRAEPGAVIFAPSLDRGVDFKHDDCRVVIVAKLPFPYLGDKQVAARLHSKGGDLWYRVQTVRSLVQSTGRGVRSESDWCITWILDRQFTENLWPKSKSLLPRWWKDALDFSFDARSIK